MLRRECLLDICKVVDRWVLFLFVYLDSASTKSYEFFMHQSPEIFHKFETLTNHFIELVVPCFIFLTRPFRITCGILQILFQVRIL